MRVQQVVVIFYKVDRPGDHRDSADFIAYLDRIYKNQNIQARALGALKMLRQREGQSFTSFLPRFEQLLVEAGGAE